MSVTILGIESSCDDTSSSVIRDGVMLSNVIASQAVHEAYGGVVPELASRAHQQNIIPVVAEAIKRAGIDKSELSAVAFTRGPGLMGSLLVGTSFAKGFTTALNIPLVDVNHLQAHVMAHFIKRSPDDNTQPPFPFLCLLVSGGNSQIIKVESYNEMTVIGQTIDDAAGEAYDKVGRVMGLTYPSGKVIDELAHKGADTYNFPRAMMNTHEVEFSFSGLKSAFINLVHNENQKGNDVIADDLENLAASFQAAVVDVLMAKTKLAMEKYPVKTLIIGGGVSANQGLRERLSAEITDEKLIIPPLRLCGDNAGMIAAAAYIEWKKGLENVQAGLDLNAKPSLVFEDIEEGEV